MLAAPPVSPVPSTRTGGQPACSRGSTRAPSWESVSMRSEMGRSRIRGVPSNSTQPLPSVLAAVRNRALVPEFWMSRERPGSFRSPSSPETVHGSWETSIGHPSAARASIITRVSSLSSPPCSRLSPWARAATNSARLVRLLEPGTRTTASSGPRGATTSESGRGGLGTGVKLAPPREFVARDSGKRGWALDSRPLSEALGVQEQR